jgi:hypothetical protein
MTISRTCFIIAVCLIVAAQATVVEAQIINAPMPDATGNVQQAVGTAEPKAHSHGIMPTSWPSIPLPTITMPKLTMPKLTMPKLSMPKWPTRPDGTYYSPFTPIVVGASKVSAGTKKAWEGTKEMFSFGGKEEASQPRLPTASQPQPSFWQRMTGHEPEPTGPQTVAEWMSQPRLDP